MQQPIDEMPGVPGQDPAEGRPELELPGADRDEPGAERRPPDMRNPTDAPARPPEPDLVPDVKVPEETM